MLLKNTWVTSLDAGGRMLAVGETGDLDPDAPPVAEHLDAGRLTALVAPSPDSPTPARPPARRAAPTIEGS